MKTTILLLLTLIAAGLILGACRNNDVYRAPGAAQLDPLPLPMYPKVTVEPPLDQHVAVDPGLVVADKSSGILSVSVPIRLISAKYGESNIQYRFKFYDAQGRELRVQTGWRRHRLPFRTQEQLQGNATDENAEDWRLEIRLSR